MTLADSYAKALHALVGAHPEKQSEYISGIKEALTRRGHEKLLPRILKSYELLELQGERRKVHAQVTPEKERSRVLLELYHKLVTTD